MKYLHVFSLPTSKRDVPVFSSMNLLYIHICINLHIHKIGMALHSN